MSLISHINSYYFSSLKIQILTATLAISFAFDFRFHTSLVVKKKKFTVSAVGDNFLVTKKVICFNQKT